MKAKRIVSILLTGSMLLSLLPVSALAAPRCSMHRPDHGQKDCTPCTGGRRLPQHRGGSRYPQQP